MSNTMECPYCHAHFVLNAANSSSGNIHLRHPDITGNYFIVEAYQVICSNSSCGKKIIHVGVYEARCITLHRLFASDNVERKSIILTKRLFPESSAKVFPQYIPEVVRTDYEEACAIKELSPKASATLARRCLQGMIRDFFDIQKESLYHEITHIESKVLPEEREVLHAIRELGNIGAHPAKDINIIVDIEENEVELLIQAIEIFVENWYVARENRKNTSQAVIALAAAKKAQKINPQLQTTT